MDYNKLADLIFADITDTVDDLEKRFPERDLPEGARVTRFAPSPTGYMKACKAEWRRVLPQNRGH